MSDTSRGRILLLVAVFSMLLLGVGFSSLGNKGDDSGKTPQPNPPNGSKPFVQPKPEIDRQSKIPAAAIKVTPDSDPYKPVMHSSVWEEPEPLSSAVNTEGAEDSPFVTPDGSTLYFFFTPDCNVVPEKQLLDQVTGIYYSIHTKDGWSEARRLNLSTGDLCLDGAVCVEGETIWFASARQGNYRGVDMWIAYLMNNTASDVRNAGARLNSEIRVGEVHVLRGGMKMYFHADLSGGKGGVDIWRTRLVDGRWTDPENVAAVNSAENDILPFLTEDGSQLWFTRFYKGSPAIYRSVKVGDGWSEPELIISNFAAEPTLDNKGNIYFCHHFIQDGKFIEADIYVAAKRKTVTPIDALSKPLRGFYLGALPIPGEGQSFEDAYAQLKMSSEFFPVWGRPTPFYSLAEDLGGVWGRTFIEDLGRKNDLFPIVHLSFMGPETTLMKPPEMTNATLSSLDWRAAYKKAVAEVVLASRPRYLSVGNEVNRWYEEYGIDGESGFRHWVSLYEEIYDEVKEISPGTIVFCTFAREIVSENREADLSVLDLFDPGKMDLLVLTSYPFVIQGVNSPDDLPHDYYVEASEHMKGKALAFSEVAWTSLEAFGGEQGQADFLRRLTDELTGDQGIELEFVGWPWLHDVDENDHTGLLTRSGSEKQAYAVWLELSKE